MRKLTASEKQIIASLIFPEPYGVIKEETGAHEGALRDDLINLVNYRFIEVINMEEDNSSKAIYFDTDNMQDCTFRATKSGLKALSKIK